MARSSLRRYTAASSLVSNPTRRFGSVCGGSRLRTESKRLGLSFAAQPAAFAVVVNRMVSANESPWRKSFVDYNALERWNLRRQGDSRQRKIQARAATERMGIVTGFDVSVAPIIWQFPPKK